MCMVLAVKFLLAVHAAISPEFMHWYPHPNVSASPRRKHFTVISIPIKDSTNKVPEAHRSIVAGNAASRERFHGWVALFGLQYSLWILKIDFVLLLLGLIKCARKDPPYLTC